MPQIRPSRGHRRLRSRRQGWLVGLACFLCGAGYAYRELHRSTSAERLGLGEDPAIPHADPDPSGTWLLPDVLADLRPAIDVDGIKAAFVILVGPNTTHELTETLGNLHRNVLAHRPRPVLLFVPGDVPAGDVAALRTRLPRPVAAAVKLVPLPDFTHMPPEFRGVRIKNIAGQRDETWIRRYPAYQNMCRRATASRGHCLHVSFCTFCNVCCYRQADGLACRGFGEVRTVANHSALSLLTEQL